MRVNINRSKLGEGQLRAWIQQHNNEVAIGNLGELFILKILEIIWHLHIFYVPGYLSFASFGLCAVAMFCGKSGNKSYCLKFKQIQKLINELNDDLFFQDKVDCGFVGSTQQTCEAGGCCWQPVEPNPGNTPWCFHTADFEVGSTFLLIQSNDNWYKNQAFKSQ